VQSAACHVTYNVTSERWLEDSIRRALQADRMAALLLRAVEAFPDDASTQGNCLLALMATFSHSGDFVKLAGLGAPEAVTRGMRRFPVQSKVQSGGCYLLSHLALHSSAPRLWELGAAELVVTTMGNFPPDHRLQPYCQSALVFLLKGWDGWGLDATAPGGKGQGKGLPAAPRLLARTMLAFPTQATTQFNGCVALEALLRQGYGPAPAGDGDDDDDDDDDGAPSVWAAVGGGMTALASQPERQAVCCAVATALAAGEGVTTMPEAVAVAAATALSAFPNASAVQTSCAGVTAAHMRRPCWDAILASRRANTSGSAAAALVSLQAHANRPECAASLTALSLEAPEAMRRWPGDAGVHSAACWLVYNVTRNRTAEVLTGLLHNGTLRLAVSALYRFEEHPKVQEACLWGLDELVSLVQGQAHAHRPSPGPGGDAPGPLTPRPPSDDDRVTVAFLVTSVARAMRRFPDTTFVQGGGCTVIWRLAVGEKGVRHRLRDEGALALVLNAMARLPEAFSVQAYCPAAVAQLLAAGAGSGGEGGHGEVARAPELLVSAMRAFPRVSHTQVGRCHVDHPQLGLCHYLGILGSIELPR
jgi:hypothetical protein